MDWWRSYLKKEKEEATFQCSECIELKRQIVKIKDNHNDTEDIAKAKRKEKKGFVENLTTHRYLTMLFNHFILFLEKVASALM